MHLLHNLLAWHLLTRKQAHNKNHKFTRVQKSDEPVKSFIVMQKAVGLIDKKIVRETLFDDENFILVLFTDSMISKIVSFYSNNNEQFLSPFCMGCPFEIGNFF